jgi:transposase-like protein
MAKRKRKYTRNRTLTPEELERLIIAYERGDRLKDIAAQFGVTWARVSYLGPLHAEHPRPVGRPPRPTPPEKQRLAVAMYKSGMSVPEIRKAIGLPEHRIEAALREAKVQMRRGHKRRNPKQDAAVAAYLAGEDSVAVGKRFGVQDRTVGRWVVADGHAMRPRFGGPEGVVRGARTRKARSSRP